MQHILRFLSCYLLHLPQLSHRLISTNFNAFTNKDHLIPHAPYPAGYTVAYCIAIFVQKEKWNRSRGNSWCLMRFREVFGTATRIEVNSCREKRRRINNSYGRSSVCRPVAKRRWRIRPSVRPSAQTSVGTRGHIIGPVGRCTTQDKRSVDASCPILMPLI